MTSAFHNSMCCSPYKALFGRHMITDGKQYELLRELEYVGDPNIELISPETNYEKIRNDVIANLKIAAQKNKHSYNLRSKRRTFNIDQDVYVRNFVQSQAISKFCAKLAPKFIKARIKKKVGNVAYSCVNSDNKVIGVYHLKDIKD